MTVNYERVKLLVEVIKGAAELGPREANSISALAVAELRAMDDAAKKEVDSARAEAKVKADAAAAEQAAATAEAAEQVEAEAEEDQQLNVHPQPPVARQRRV